MVGSLHTSYCVMRKKKGKATFLWSSYAVRSTQHAVSATHYALSSRFRIRFLPRVIRPVDRDRMRVVVDRRHWGIKVFGDPAERDGLLGEQHFSPGNDDRA